MSRSTASVAAAICRSCHIAPDRFDDAVQETVIAMVGAPRRHRAAAARTVRKHLARQLGLAARSLGTDLAAVKMIGQYEAELAHADAAAASIQNSAPHGQFDYHSRRFAIENQVCPRCGRPGLFRSQPDRCQCGWQL